jgi:membrane-associated protein
VHVDKSLNILLQNYGTLVYALLFAIIFAETGVVVLFFLPGDTLLFIAGAYCASGHMHPVLLGALLIFAAVLGNTTNYLIGKAIGERVFTHDYRWIDRNALNRTHAFFEKHGGKTIILARFVPVVRTFAPFVAGVSKMTFHRFQLYNVSGATLWVALLVTVGYYFGSYPPVREHLNAIVLFGTAVAAAPVALGALWKLVRRMSKR